MSIYTDPVGQNLLDIELTVRMVLENVDLKKVPESMKRSEAAVKLMQLNGPFRKFFFEALRKNHPPDLPEGSEECLLALQKAVKKRSPIWN